MNLRSWIVLLLFVSKCGAKSLPPAVNGTVISDAGRLDVARIRITDPCNVTTTYANVVYGDNWYGIVFPIFKGYGESIAYPAIEEKLQKTKFPDAYCAYKWDIPKGQEKKIFHELIDFYAARLHLKRSPDGAVVPDVIAAEHDSWLFDYSFEQNGVKCYIRIWADIEDEFQPSIKDTRKLRFRNKAGSIPLQLYINAVPKNPWKN